MEFSKYLGGGVAPEECSSSESGWTMYIVSPRRETNYNNHQYDYQGHGGHDHERIVDDHGIIDKSHNGDHKMYRNEDSDDSMVSDASSCPSRQAILSKKRGGGLRRESRHSVNQKQAEKKLHDRRQRVAKEDRYKTRIDVVVKAGRKID